MPRVGGLMPLGLNPVAVSNSRFHYFGLWALPLRKVSSTGVCMNPFLTSKSEGGQGGDEVVNVEESAGFVGEGVTCSHIPLATTRGCGAEDWGWGWGGGGEPCPQATAGLSSGDLAFVDFVGFCNRPLPLSHSPEGTGLEGFTLASSSRPGPMPTGELLAGPRVAQSVRWLSRASRLLPQPPSHWTALSPSVSALLSSPLVASSALRSGRDCSLALAWRPGSRFSPCPPPGASS